ncbi:GntR family transcriptional regulator [Kribbella hippodromi]|uniref:GntR family transcriptional regulator n=1 Tax=Kribbella hippodromi TaxID=434347 RepID=A0ABN2BZU9_9ACTN
MSVFSGRPAYLQIADDLRSQILEGALQADDKLPSEPALMDDYGVSRIVVRQALDVLRAEGLIVKQQGRGSFVRALVPPTKRVLGHLYNERPEGSPFAAVTSAGGQRPEWDYQSRKTAASKVIADRLGIAPGDPVMRTSYRFLADDEPVMLSTSFEPLAITGGTSIEQPESGTVTGVVPRFDQIGLHITHVKEDVNGRAARPYEAETLQVPQGVPVLVIERTYYVEDQPVETADIVVSSARYVLSYRLEIPPRT